MPSPAAPKALPQLLISALLAAAVLLAMYYLLDYYTKSSAKLEGASGQGQPRLAASLRLPLPPPSAEECRAGRVQFHALLRIENLSAQTLYLLQTPWPDALCRTRVFYKYPDGRLEAVPRTPPAAPWPREKLLPDESPCTYAELKPGQALAWPVAISPPAQLTRAGFYRLEASYDPALFAKENGIDLGELQVEALRLQTPPLDFEISESLPPSR